MHVRVVEDGPRVAAHLAWLREDDPQQVRDTIGAQARASVTMGPPEQNVQTAGGPCWRRPHDLRHQTREATCDLMEEGHLTPRLADGPRPIAAGVHIPARRVCGAQFAGAADESPFTQVHELTEKADVLWVQKPVEERPAAEGASGFAQPGDPSGSSHEEADEIVIAEAARRVSAQSRQF